MEGVVVGEGTLTTAVSDNEYQGQREKSDQKRHSSQCYFRGLLRTSTCRATLNPGVKRKINNTDSVFI